MQVGLPYAAQARASKSGTEEYHRRCGPTCCRRFRRVGITKLRDLSRWLDLFHYIELRRLRARDRGAGARPVNIRWQAEMAPMMAKAMTSRPEQRPPAAHIRALIATEPRPAGAHPLQVTPLGLGTAPLGGLFEAVTTTRRTGSSTRALAGWDPVLSDTARCMLRTAEQRLGALLRTKPRGSSVLDEGRQVAARRRSGRARPGVAGHPPLNPVFRFFIRRGDAVGRGEPVAAGHGRVDLLLIHDPDHHTNQALSGAYRALDRLRAEVYQGCVGAG